MTYREERKRAIERWERAYWRRLMLDCNGNITEAARQTQMTRTGVYFALKRLRIYSSPADRKSIAIWSRRAKVNVDARGNNVSRETIQSD